MKKTIITAAIALAFAATASALSLSDAVLTGPTYTSEEPSTMNLTYTGEFSTSSGSGNTTRGLTTVTVVFDWAKLSGLSLTETGTAALTVGSTGTTATYGYGFKLVDNAIKMYTQYNGGFRSNSLNVSDYVVDGKVALTLTTFSGTSGTRIYALKSTGATGQYTTDSSLFVGYPNGVTSLTFSENIASAIDSFYVFDNTHSEAEIISVAQAAVASATAVPEPATATLSLLALAGLAMHRRRK